MPPITVPTTRVCVRRLHATDRDAARALFRMMADVFEEPQQPLRDAYLDVLLSRPEFWAVAAFDGDEVIGGLTAHTIPMTRAEASELFVYDVAVRAERQRQGVGRQLLATVRSLAAEAGIVELFVPAETEDEHALDFYRAMGGEATPVVMFGFQSGNQGDAAAR